MPFWFMDVKINRWIHCDVTRGTFNHFIFLEKKCLFKAMDQGRPSEWARAL